MIRGDEGRAASRHSRRLRLLGMAVSTAVSLGSAIHCWAEEPDGYPSVQSSPRNDSTPSVPRPQELPIDLPTVLRLAGSDSLDVKLADERLTEARARRLSADMKFLPAIQPVFDNRWHTGPDQAVTGNFVNVDKQASLLGARIGGEWKIGESVYQSLAARRRVVANESGVRSSTEDAQIRAVNAFFDLVLSRADQAVVEDRIKQAEETVRMTEELLKGGAGLLSEVKRAQAARAEVKQRLSVAKEKTRLASLNLTDILHVDPLVTLVPRQEPQDMLILVSPDRDITDLVIDAIAYRPELKQSRAFWNALDSERKAALIGPLIPTLRAEAFDGGFGRHPNELGHSTDYSVGLQWKVGAGGIGDVSRVRIAASLQQQESIRFMQASDRIVREVVKNLTHADSTKEQIALSKEEVAAASESLRLSRERLKNGAALTIELISAEDALFSAELRAAGGVTEFNKAEYGLLRSIGGFRNTDALIGTKNAENPVPIPNPQAPVEPPTAKGEKQAVEKDSAPKQ